MSKADHIRELMLAGKTNREVIEETGISDRYARTCRAKLAKQGFAPEHDMTHTVPDGYKVKGVSTYYNKDGKPTGQWVKTNEDAARQAELLQEAISAFVADLPRLDVMPAPSTRAEEFMTVYPIGDAHIGMLAWGEECGADWDMHIAERVMCGAMSMLVGHAPEGSDALIVDVGDFLHSDNMAGVTERSGHVLDMDGRYSKVIRVAQKVLRQCIDSALEHHNRVFVRCCQGNHNDTGALWLTAVIKAVYEKEPRVVVLDSPSLFDYHQFGKVLIGMTHGHTAKAEKLAGEMAAAVPEMWGSTRHRVWHTGHVHHETVKEYAGCTVETHGILAAKDSYAASHAYRAKQQMKAIVYHREFGEVQRLTVNPEMLK